MANDQDQSNGLDEQDAGSVLPIDEHEEIVSEGGRQVRKRGVYLLPNLLTLGAMFSGFYAIIAGMGGNFNAAGWAVLVASIFDGFDGRVARMTGTQSSFGAEFDSLSDMVSFGMAPALIAFSWALSSLGNAGWAAAFIFMACAALRLARFNVQLGTVTKRYFLGLQSPLAAGVVTFSVWVGALYEVQVTPLVAYSLAVVTVVAGLLMVSNYRYFSFKEMHLKGTVPYVVFLLVVVVFVLIAQNPHETLLAMCVIYALSGPVVWVYRRQGRKPASKTAAAVGKGGATADVSEHVASDSESQVRPDEQSDRQFDRQVDKDNVSSEAVSEDPEPEAVNQQEVQDPDASDAVSPDKE
jgi:CDP-diacylglycerol--serine O-phosphatidyltransferase